MEGELLKWTNYIFGWRERYFVLKGSVLHYYYRKGEKPKGRIHLGVCQVITSEGENKIELDTGINVIYLKSETKELKDEWMKAFRLAKKDSDNKQQVNVNRDQQANNNNLNSLRGENAAEFNSQRNSVMTEDKLLCKINQLNNKVDKIISNNEKFSKILQNNSNPELNKLLNEYNVFFYI